MPCSRWCPGCCAQTAWNVGSSGQLPQPHPSEGLGHSPPFPCRQLGFARDGAPQAYLLFLMNIFFRVLKSSFVPFILWTSFCTDCLGVGTRAVTVSPGLHRRQCHPATMDLKGQNSISLNTALSEKCWMLSFNSVCGHHNFHVSP